MVRFSRSSKLLFLQTGSPKFHVQWTGIAEIFGGLGLTVGGVASLLHIPLPIGNLVSISGAALLLLTAVVTPGSLLQLN